MLPIIIRRSEWMKMKKMVSTLLVALLITGTVVTTGGCSQSKSGSSSTASDANKPVTLSVMWWGAQARHDSTNKVLQMYTEKHPNVKFQATPLGWNGYQDKMATQAAGGALPDIFQNDYTFIDTFSKNKSLADMSSYVKNKTIDMTNVDSTLVSTGKVDGKMTGIVISIGAPAISYNPDVFTKAGLSMPTDNWTWEDLVNDCLTIKQKLNVYGELELFAPAGGPMNNLNLWLRQYGTQIYANDGTKVAYTNDKYLVDYIDMIKKLTDAGAAPNPDQEAQIQTKSKDQFPVVNGGAGMIFDNLNYPVLAAKSNPNLKNALYPCSVKGAKPNYTKPGMFFSVAQTSKNKQAAAEFINYFINDENANTALNAERGVPVSSKIREYMMPSLSAQNKEMFNYVDRVEKNSSKISPPEPNGAAEVQTDLINEINAVLYGKKTSEQAAKDFRSEANQVLSQNA